MATPRDVLKNLNLFVDGRGYAGQVDDYTPPALTMQTEEYRAGGMDAPVDISMGMEKMEASFNLIAYDRDVLSQFGLAEGNLVQLTARGALESFDGSRSSVVHNMRGKVTSISRGTWTAGQKPQLSVTMSLVYYRETHGGIPIHEIDIENMIRIVNGIDQLKDEREALGI